MAQGIKAQEPRKSAGAGQCQRWSSRWEAKWDNAKSRPEPWGAPRGGKLRRESSCGYCPSSWEQGQHIWQEGAQRRVKEISKINVIIERIEASRKVSQLESKIKQNWLRLK